jgi:replication-associated recombination protein RarA
MIETPGGYLCGEVASALQKSIRRGHERESLFWATELDLAGYGNYVWKRPRIISSEDVGIAEPDLPAVLRALYENWKEARAKKDDPPSHHRVFLVHAVVLLARARKSRMLDHVLMVMYDGDRPHLEIPDYALDKHTARGRRMGRGLQHFFEEGARLENETTIPDLYADEGRDAHIRAEQPRSRPTALPADQGELDLSDT